MKIKDCHFTKENIMISVSNEGIVFLANKDEKTIYQVSVVKVAKTILPKSKSVKIKRKKAR